MKRTPWEHSSWVDSPAQTFLLPAEVEADSPQCAGPSASLPPSERPPPEKVTQAESPGEPWRRVGTGDAILSEPLHDFPKPRNFRAGKGLMVRKGYHVVKALV